ncbi:MAG TPA: hypothetical protein ENI23_13235 [bacterium]|nr:hypothetical protein [bacterium]
MVKKDYLSIAKTVFYLGMCVLILVWAYHGIRIKNIDWDKVSQNLEETIIAGGEAIDCSIEYKDSKFEFNYEGLCVERTEIIDLIKNLTAPNVSIITKESFILDPKLEEMNCLLGCYHAFDELKVSENTISIDGFWRNNEERSCDTYCKKE